MKRSEMALIAKCYCAECRKQARYAERHYAECRRAECRGTENRQMKMSF